jgi:hypothetical protein
MARIDVLQNRMIKTMPLPEPVAGPRLGRVRLAAAAIAEDPIAVVDGNPVPGNEPQTGNALQQLKVNAALERVASQDAEGHTIPATAWDVAQAMFWAFEPVSEAGASDVFLDRWGKMLQVPRILNESDSDYGLRMVTTIIQPSTTNLGLGLLIDQLLGITGTRVLDSQDFFSGVDIRLNDGRRINDGWRLTPNVAFGVAGTWNCFMVVLPVEIPAGFTNKQINALVDQKRAAGNRKVATITPTTFYQP